MKIRPVSPEIPRFAVPDVADWFKVHPAPQQERPVSGPDAQEVKEAVQQGAGMPTPPAQESGAQELRAGDLVMCLYDETWVPGHIVSDDGKGWISAKYRKPGGGKEDYSAWDPQHWRLPTPAERSLHASPDGEWHEGKPPREGMYVTRINIRDHTQFFNRYERGGWIGGMHALKDALAFRDDPSSIHRPWRYLTPAEQSEYDRLTA